MQRVDIQCVLLINKISREQLVLLWILLLSQMDDGLVPTHAGMTPTWLQNVEARPKVSIFPSDQRQRCCIVVGSRLMLPFSFCCCLLSLREELPKMMHGLLRFLEWVLWKNKWRDKAWGGCNSYVSPVNACNVECDFCSCPVATNWRSSWSFLAFSGLLI